MRPASDNILKQFVTLASASGSCEYNDDNKRKFHRWGKAAAERVAQMMGLLPGSYDIRSNLGGIAVSGEVTLHGESIYIQFAQCCMGDSFMFRQCNGRKDYTGKRNHWMKWEDLLDIDNAVETFKSVASNG